MLRVDPNRRPKPQVSANVIALSLFRFGHDIRLFMKHCGLNLGWNLDRLKASLSTTLSGFAEELERKISTVVELYAAETIVSRLISPAIISSAELQVCLNFFLS